MATIKKYNGSSWENAVVRKFGTATEAVENPLYSDGTVITSYTIKGNTVQSGTPTPSAPISVNGVGNKTANLFDYSDLEDGTINNNGEPVPYTGHKRTAHFINVESSTTYRLSNIVGSERVQYYDNTKTFISNALIDNVFTTPSNCGYVKFSGAATGWTQTTMLTKGSTAPTSYIPYGYEIPISSNGAALTPAYLTEQLMKIGDTADSLVSTGTVTRALKKFVFDGTENDWQVASTTVGVRFNIPVPDINESIASSPKSICSHFFLGTSSTDYGAYSISYAGGSVTKFICKPESTITTVTELKQWLADQYAAGTPLTLWGVADTPTTETVTAPSIPTTQGANTITVDTTVQPSEFTATWTGWHDNSVKEYDGTDWQ